MFWNCCGERNLRKRATRISAVESRSCIGVLRGGNCEIGQKPISNPKSEISDLMDVQLQISDLGCKIQDSSDFKFPRIGVRLFKYVDALWRRGIWFRKLSSSTLAKFEFVTGLPRR